MKLKNLFTIASLSFTTALYAGNAHAVNLQESLVTAYQNNAQLKVEQQNALSRFEQVPASYAGFLPTISADGNIRRKKLQSLSTGNKELYSSDKTEEIAVTEQLFNGGETVARVNRAYDVSHLARADLQDIEAQVLIGAVSAHMDVVRDLQVLELSKNNEKVLKEQLESTKERFQLGETTRTDVAQAESRYASAISDRIKAEGQLTASIANYRNAMGLGASANINPADFQMPVANIQLPPTLEAAMDQAFQNNPTLISQQYAQKIGERDVSIAYANLLPDVSLRGSMSREKDEFTQFDQEFNENAVQVSLTVPLYQGGAEYARVREAKKTSEKNKFSVDKVKDQLRESITKAWEDILTSRASIQSNSESVRSAAVALDGVKQEQAVGTRTILDVLDAEQELFQTKVNLVNSERNEIVALYNLKFYMGDLTAQTLALPVEPFDVEGNFRKTKYKIIGF